MAGLLGLVALLLQIQLLGLNDDGARQCPCNASRIPNRKTVGGCADAASVSMAGGTGSIVSEPRGSARTRCCPD